MLPFRATPAIQTMRVVVSSSGNGLFPRPAAAAAGIIGLDNNQRHFFLPALQQRFASIGSSGGRSSSGISSGSKSGSPLSAMDEMIDVDIDISDPPEAVGAANAATARANRERMGRGRGAVDEEGNTVLYASAGALGLLGLYSVFHENPIESSGSSSSSSGGGPLSRSSNELDPGTDARGRTSPLSSISSSSSRRQHHDLPAHAPGGETLEFKLGRG